MSIVENVHYVAIVGRPNVGKSTLFNRLLGRRVSITDEQSGTTRDRVYHSVDINDKSVYLIDTGGIQYAQGDVIDYLVDQEVNKAIIEAHVVVFLCDIEGITSLEYKLAEDLRRRKKKTLLLINKVDEGNTFTNTKDYYSLGFGEPVCISALHGSNLDELVDTLYNLLPKDCHVPDVEHTFDLALVGEPNAGKSTLLNLIIEKDRAVVSDIAGTTRDSIEEYFNYKNVLFRIIDTAGIRKKKKLKSSAAVFSLFRATKRIETADIVVLLIDATKGPQKDTRLIYKTIVDNRKACIVVVNKWDLIKGIPMETFKKDLIYECGFWNNTPMCFISAISGRNKELLLDQVLGLWHNYSLTIPTKDLNRFLQVIKDMKKPPPRVKLKYLVQVATKPPRFLLFVKNKKLIKKNYLQYITNEITKAFTLEGVMPHVILKEEERN